MKYRLRDVLAVVPLTDDGKIVLTQATNLHEVLSCRVFVLYVIPPFPFSKFRFNSLKVKDRINTALQELTEFVGDFYLGVIPEFVILKVIMGNLVSTLIKQAQGGDFLFIILKRSIFQKGVSCLLEQHEIDKIIGHSYCPILSINATPTPKEIKNILVPIDISEATTKRLLWASMFAKKTGAKIRIISALKINIDEKKSLAFKNAEKIKSMLMERGIECKVELIKVQGQIMHEVVLAYIATHKSDFVIIRKHHVASYFSTTIGDFAKEIIRGSGIPVFTVSQSQKDIESILPFDFF